MKSTLAEGQENAQRVLSVKDAQELLALQASLAQPVAEKVLSYDCHLYEIASSTQAEFARVAEEQYEDQNRKVQTLVENVAKNAPAGSETAVAVMKSAITYETIHKASKLAKSRKVTSTQPLRPPRRLHRKLPLKLRAPPRRLSNRLLKFGPV